ncbi:MAG: biotin--[acetyl-CoA-carboxylase] ligase [Flavobacteriales bacterium]|nr:biotin--[acetyl-CoA-carboxylase] ligase [Flavobacteriales bacterium]MCW8912690.1 biotin--[acetyl-CoA-carboxylase] ligase [Flavobacteriales bacterium]MCW8938833.1 biotin--[acetyl-CoA-carboxylase] ligase [Flavobacteriales bacterium]MCW8941371.1 biotin--[acetyl-CoA-carboxylase] ligase [Flavobacteriales bacterium]MCW8968143.1 biotin--[acetyl-CoA-carboxylase] ligase [Flavobacteriales bacterium]
MYDCLFLGSQIIRLDEVDSTNIYATNLIKNQSKIITDGMIIYTDNQTNGRGQRGSAWETTPNKNLTFSIVLKPNLLINEQFILSKICALGILDFLTDLNIKNTSIKWPNDIYVGKQKIAGMLLENTLKNSKIEFCIAGIGVNINQTVFNEHLQQATSLQLITNKSYDLKSILNQLLFFIEKRYLQLKAGKLQQINKDYLNHLLGYNTERTYLINNQKVLGVINGVTPSGKLQLTHENNLHEYDMKEIGFVF